MTVTVAETTGLERVLAPYHVRGVPRGGPRRRIAALVERRRDVADVSNYLAGLSGLAEKIGTDLDALGGFLRCEECSRVQTFGEGDRGRFTASGWPKCCGYTMRWWTQRQIGAGEVPCLS